MRTGSIIIDLEGTVLTEMEKKLIQHPLVSGIIFFARNYQSRKQLRSLTKEIRSIAPHLLLTVDQEGGRVQRFQTDFTILPAQQKLGQLYDRDANLALQLAEQIGWLMAHELLTVGVDLSFAPVLDTTQGINPMLDCRCLHHDPRSVAALASQYIAGMQRAGMAAVGKHFPGHGGVAADSHNTLPRDERTWQELNEHDIYPFKQLIRAGLRGVMPSHIVYPTIDELPTNFSKIWLQDILREQLGFTGTVFTDDLSMEGAAQIGDHLQRTQQAFAAGCDVALICNNRAAVLATLDHLSISNDASNLNSLRGKILPDNTPEAHPEWRNTINTLNQVFAE